MRLNQLSSLWIAFGEFYRFAPGKVLLCLLLMLFQGLTAGVGMLLLIPLLQLVGFDLTAGASHEFSQSIKQLFSVVNIPLTLPVILATYIVTVTVIALLKYVLTVMTVVLQQNYICMLRDRLFRALLHARWQFIIEHRMSDFTHSLSGQVQTIGHSSQQMLTLFSQIILTLVYLLLSLMLSWQMSLLALACAAFLFMILTPLNKYIYQSGQTQLVGFKNIFHILTEQLTSLKMIKSYASESYYADELLKVGHTLEQQNVRMTRFNALTRMIYLVGAVISFSILFYFAITWLEISLATLLLLLLIFSRLLPQVSGIQTTIQQLLHQIPAFTDVRTMMAECFRAREATLTTATLLPQIKEAIHIKNLSFCYPNQNSPVITDLSLDIVRNQTTALTGASGAGKSTLADLIAGLLAPTSGTIFCDNIELKGEMRLAWRKNIAYITQEVYLFHDTIRNNLSWVKKDAPDEEIWDMLNMAAAGDFVEKLPHGLDTVIGDRGIRLSGGERQRLALARALLSQPQLLILDEATSALDHENERKIQQALEHLQGRLTIIIIAHRKTTIEHVDQTIRL